MTLIANTGSFAKVKNIHVALSGFSASAGATSTFGTGNEINCPDVEYLALTLPEKAENEATEINTNMRDIKDSVPTKAWDDWNGMEVFADDGGVNNKAFVAAQECDSTGTVTITVVTNAGATNTYGAWKAKVSKAGGGGGDANSVNTSFTPTFTLIESISAGSSNT